MKENIMKNEVLYRLSHVAAVAAIAAGLLAFSGLAGARGGPSPLLIGSHWHENGQAEPGTLVGGLDTEATVNMFHFPIHVGDLVFTHGDIECPDVGEDAKAQTKLLPPGTRLVMYGLNGQVLGTGVSGDVRFSCTDLYGDIYLTPDLQDVTVKVKEYAGYYLSMRDDMKFAAVPTKRIEENGNPVFVTENGEAAVILTIVKEDGEELLAGILRQGGKEREMFRINAPDSADGIFATFIDLNADGVLEFFIDNDRNYTAIYNTASVGSGNAAFAISYGD